VTAEPRQTPFLLNDSGRDIVLVTGATGQVGRPLVEQLNHNGSRARALSRRPERAGLPDGVEVFQGDLTDSASLELALTGVDALFLWPAEDHGAAALEAAGRAGVRRVVLLSSLSVEDFAGTPIAEFHIRAEEAVRRSGMACTILRPGVFASNALDWAPAIRAGSAVRAPFADTPVVPIDPQDIASVACHALTAEGAAGHTYSMTGPAIVTARQQVAAIAEALGRHVDFVELDLVAMREAMAGNAPQELIDSMEALSGEDGRPNLKAARILDVVPDLTGRPARTFEEWAAEHVEAFR
jgi:uncharacterized protein YbjT (DUF2867 family)